MELYETNGEYPFEDISLQTPQPLQGGTYLAKVVNNDESIIFQTPKCKTKKGVHKTGKKTYCDLLFDMEQQEFIEWIYTLEQTIQELIFDKKEYWFVESDLTLDDIEYNWVNTIKKYKKQHLMRTFLSKSKGYLNGLQVYDHNQNLVDEEKITINSDLICIIEITGLKFSATSFHMEFGIKQIMILENKPKYQSCMIKLKNKKVHYEDENNLEEENTNNENVDDDKVDDDKVNDENVDDENVDDENVDADKVNDENVDDDKIDDENVDDDKIDDEKKVEMEFLKEENEKIDQKNEEKAELNKNNELENTTIDEIVETPKEENVEKEPIKEENEKIQESVEKVENAETDETLVKNKILNEIVLDVPKNEKETISLRNPNEVYLDIYKAARQKAKEAKREAIKAYLTVKKIKQQYLIDESEISEEESDDDFLFSEK